MNNEPTRLTDSNEADPTAATLLNSVTPSGPTTSATDQDTQLVGGAPAIEPQPDTQTSAATVIKEAAEPAPLHGIPPGTLLVNTYQVERLLGGGGMGEVYLARHAGLGTQHAIKVIRPAMAANRQVMDLFYREAKVLRGVRHDAVVSYDGFVRDAEGRDYLVMEYVDGASLGERLRQGPLPEAEVLTLRDRLAAGLAEAHRRGAIHRDISPDNVILPDQRVADAKLIDFGLSKLTDPTQETIIGSSFAGKFRFASPEQFGMFGGVVDGRSDIYSLGLILAAAAIGHPLDMGNTFEAALRARQSVPDLTGIPAPLRPWLTAMLEPDPARRPASLDDLLLRWPALTQVARRSGPVVGPVAPDQIKPQGRKGLWLWGSGAVLAAVVVTGLYMTLRPLDSDLRTGDKPAAPLTTSDRSAGTQPARPGSGSPGTPASDLDALIEAGRYDEALKAARSLIASPPATGLPVESLVDLAKQLRAAGRPAEAFALVQAMMETGAKPLATALWPLALDLRAAGLLDPYFFLARTLANQDYGPATFALAEMYDPLHWSVGTSPIKPRADKASEWYEKAAALGIPEARERLAALKSRSSE